MSEAKVPVAREPGPSPAGARKSPVGWIAAGVVAVMVLLGLWYYWNRSLSTAGVNSPAAVAQESVNVLALGISEDSLDAVTVLSFDPRTQGMAAVAVPVDTRVGDDDGVRLLQDVYAEDGLDGLIAVIQGMLGAPLHHTLQVDFAGFEALVDLLGGVTVEVDTDIIYRNADGETVFHLDPGVHFLDGRQALLYLRYKGDHLEDESRRVRRQWRFLTAVAEQARTSLDWSRVQGMLSLAIRHVQTDIDATMATRLVQLAWQTDTEMALHLLPGRPEDGEWILETQQVQALSQSLFYNPSWVASRP